MSDAHEDRRDRPTPSEPRGDAAGQRDEAAGDARHEPRPAVDAPDLPAAPDASGASAAPDVSGEPGAPGGAAASDASDASDDHDGSAVPDVPEGAGASVGPTASDTSRASDALGAPGDGAGDAPCAEGAGGGAACAGDGGADRGGNWSDLDEDDVRRLLHIAVRDLEPDDGSLERLRHAVPARRQRRRQLVMGAVAALVVVGASVPVAVRVAPDLGANDRRANTASSRSAPQGPGGAQADGGAGGAGHRGQGKNGHGVGGSSRHGRGSSGSAGAGAAPTQAAGGDITAPACGRDQLGQGASTLQPAEADGRIYGRFRVVNTSGAACTVEGGGTVSAVAEGSARPTGIQVVDHTAGDAASGLPDPTDAADQLVLQPGQAYEVKFAWVPQSGGGTSGCGTAPGAPTEAPAPTPSGDTGSDSSQSAAGDAGAQAGGDNGSGDTPASVRLSHTPEAGEPAAVNATLPDACAGTLYRTGALPAS